jgi:hypothetical protein
MIKQLNKSSSTIPTSVEGTNLHKQSPSVPFSIWKEEPKGHPIKGRKEKFLFPIFNVLQISKKKWKKKHKHLLIVRIKQKKKAKKLTSQLLIEQKQGGRRR